MQDIFLYIIDLEYVAMVHMFPVVLYKNRATNVFSFK